MSRQKVSQFPLDAHNCPKIDDLPGVGCYSVAGMWPVGDKVPRLLIRINKISARVGGSNPSACMRGWSSGFDTPISAKVGGSAVVLIDRTSCPRARGCDKQFVNAR